MNPWAWLVRWLQPEPLPPDRALDGHRERDVELARAKRMADDTKRRLRWIDEQLEVIQLRWGGRHGDI